jgi:hypothetical protein
MNAPQCDVIYIYIYIYILPVLFGIRKELKFKDTVEERTVSFVKFPEACGLHLQGMRVSLLNIEAIPFFVISNFCPTKQRLISAEVISSLTAVSQTCHVGH